MNNIEIIKELLEIVKFNEWQIHHAAENQYCPFCFDDKHWWIDQFSHNDNCRFVNAVNAAEKYLQEHEND